MADKKLHFLVIDDDINIILPFAAARANLPDAEVVLVQNSGDAISQLAKWIEAGIDADGVVCDLNPSIVFNEGEGWHVLQKVDAWLKSIHPTARSPRFYIQSKDYKEMGKDISEAVASVMNGRECTVISTFEWDDIARGHLTDGNSGSFALREHISALRKQKAKDSLPVQKLHILIIDDDVNTIADFSRIRANIPNAEIVIGKNSEDAIAQLDKWHARGVVPDIIVSDLLLQYSEYGYNVLKNVNEWMQSTGSDFGATRFYIQSKNVEHLGPSMERKALRITGRECQLIDTGEWNNIAAGHWTSGASWTVILREKIAELLAQKSENEAPNMIEVDANSEPKVTQRHILIVDDDINTIIDFDDVRQKLSGVKVVITHSSGEAIAQLAAWHQNNITADAVTVDVGLLSRTEDTGRDALIKIDEWLLSVGREKGLPDFFLQAKNGDSTEGSVDSYNWGVEYGQKHPKDSNPVRQRLTVPMDSYEWRDIAYGHMKGGESRSSTFRDYIAQMLSQKENALHTADLAQHTKEPFRYLLIDDDLAALVSGLPDVFSDLGVNAEFVVVRTYKEAIRKLEQWKLEGKKADVVDLDQYIPYGRIEAGADWPEQNNLGYYYDLSEYVSGIPEDLRPSQIIMHSKDSGDLYNYLCADGMEDKIFIYDVDEWLDVRKLASSQMPRISAMRGHGNGLIKFLDEKLRDRTFTQNAEVEDGSLSDNTVAAKESLSTFNLRQTATEPFRILLIDDDILAYVDRRELFENTSANVEVVTASSGNHAWQLIDMYAAEGKGFDIIDADYFLDARIKFTSSAGQEIGRGLASLKYVIESCESLPESLRPQQFLLHSKDTHKAEAAIVDYAPELIGKTLIYDSSEWQDIMKHGNNYENSDDLEGRTTTLREYFNRTLGTNFPLTDVEIALMKTPDGKLDIYAVQSAIEEGLLSKIDGLSRLKLAPDLVEIFMPHINSDWATKNEIHEDLYHDCEGSDVAGKVAFNEEQILALREQGHAPILFLNTFEPSQTHLLNLVSGIVLLDKATGHLRPLAANHGIKAVMDKSGRCFIENDEAGNLSYVVKDYQEKEILARLRYGDNVTLGGQCVYHGKVPFSEFYGAGRYEEIMEWQREILTDQSALAIKANADTPAQVRKSIEFSADGLGLLRTEHMFFANGRLDVLQTALLTNDTAERNVAFAKLKGFQKTDFAEILSAAAITEKSFPVTIRLLDAPPEEFMSAEQMQTFIAKVGPENTRGVQLAECIPGLYAMQAEAIFEAAKETEFNGQLDVMIPLVRTVEEFRAAKQEVTAAAEKTGMTGKYKIRAMIETLDAVKNAAKIAQEADGLSFGTNDLTSESMGGVARNDIVATREWMARLDVNHVGKSPFLRLSDTVKKLMEETVAKARAAKSGIDIGICGHQVAGEADSIEFCHRLGLDSISVPAAPEYLLASRIIVGQATLNHSRGPMP